MGSMMYLSPKKLKQLLQKNHFKSGHRHGKYLFEEREKNGWLVLHFGITGFFSHIYLFLPIVSFR